MHSIIKIRIEDIPANTVLGFHYGPYYWLNRLPGIMATSGALIPKNDYKWRQIFIGNQFTWEGVYREKVKYFCRPNYNWDTGLSLYQYRHCLVEANFLPNSYLPLTSYETILKKIKLKWEECFGKKNVFKVNAYYHDPDASKLAVDLVCHIKPHKYKLYENNVTEFFKPLPVKKSPKTAEIIIHDINESEQANHGVIPAAAFNQWLSLSFFKSDTEKTQAIFTGLSPVF